MTEVQRLETEVKKFDKIIERLELTMTKFHEMRGQVVMNLNRARRLEREELQNAKQ